MQSDRCDTLSGSDRRRAGSLWTWRQENISPSPFIDQPYFGWFKELKVSPVLTNTEFEIKGIIISWGSWPHMTPFINGNVLMPQSLSRTATMTRIAAILGLVRGPWIYSSFTLRKFDILFHGDHWSEITFDTFLISEMSNWSQRCGNYISHCPLISSGTDKVRTNHDPLRSASDSCQLMSPCQVFFRRESALHIVSLRSNNPCFEGVVACG